MQRIDLTGKTFGKWKVLGYVGGAGSKWLATCTGCNENKEVSGQSLRLGTSVSCSQCAGLSRRVEVKTTDLPYFKEFMRMNQRVKNGKKYVSHNVQVCEQWSNVTDFNNWVLENLGECPEGHKIELISFDKDYEPGNIEFRYCKPPQKKIDLTSLEEVKALYEKLLSEQGEG